MDRATKSSTDREQEPGQECAECGWPFGPALTRAIVRGRLQTVCDDPWSCWERRETLDYFLAITAGARPTTSR